MLTLEDVLFRRDMFELTASFSLGANARTAVIGPSGGGKSTLLALISGFEAADRGRVFWGGDDLSDQPPEGRPIAMLFQDNNLFPHLDIETNVALGLEPVARPSRDARDKAREALRRVGLADQVRARPGALSGGQQSRAALARLTLTAKPLVLLDEPFAALGPAQRREMWDLLIELLPQATIVMVTHDPDEAARSASEVIFVDEGQVDAPVATPEFFASARENVQRYLR